jgi:hypothetical protein
MASVVDERGAEQPAAEEALINDVCKAATRRASAPGELLGPFLGDAP